MAFWKGPGVFQHKGKDIPPGKELPSTVDKETIERLIKKGLASKDAPSAAAPVASDDSAKIIKALRDELAEAGQAVIELKDLLVSTSQNHAEAVAQLEALRSEHAEAVAQLEASQKAVTELTKQLQKGK